MPNVKKLTQHFEELARGQQRSLQAVTSLIETDDALDQAVMPPAHSAYSFSDDAPMNRHYLFVNSPGTGAGGNLHYLRTDPGYGRTPPNAVQNRHYASPGQAMQPAPLRGSAAGNAPAIRNAPAPADGLYGVNDYSSHHDKNNADFKRVPANDLAWRFGVSIGAVMQRRGLPFDTAECRSNYAAKSKQWTSVPARLGRSSNGQSLLPPDLDWFDATLIWVCIPTSTGTPRFFSNIGKLSRFHHSSFTGGGKVLGAGEWIVRKGKLLGINGNSGHYRPPIAALQRCVQLLAGALHAETNVMVFDVQRDQYTTVPAFQFMVTGASGGRYKAHADER